MAFSPIPTGWLGATYTGDATSMTIPIADFLELTAAEADEVTGDIRKILFAVLSKMAAKYESLPVADRPLKMTIQRGYGAISGGASRVTFTTSFNLSVGNLEVLPE